MVIKEQLQKILDQQQAAFARHILENHSNDEINALVQTQRDLATLIRTGTFIEEDDRSSDENIPADSPADKAFLNMMNDKKALDAADNVEEGYFHTNMIGGVIETNKHKIEIGEKYVREHGLRHDDKVQVIVHSNTDFQIVDVYHPEIPRENRYVDVLTIAKMYHGKIFINRTIDGRPLSAVTPFDSYIVPDKYAASVHMKPGDIVTLRYNSQAYYPKLRVVWVVYGNNHFRSQVDDNIPACETASNLIK